MTLPNEIHPLQLAASSGGFEIEQSLRFDQGGYFSRTFPSSGDRNNWTFSVWLKRSGGIGNNDRDIFCGYTGGARLGLIECGLGYPGGSADQFGVDRGGDASAGVYYTNGRYRDPSAWYHLVVSVDYTNATQANRARIFVNGVNHGAAYNDLASGDGQINGNWSHWIGQRGDGESTSNRWDGYMAELHFLDGITVTDASSFGESDANGVWRPIAYTGSYNTNGFYLKFDPSATNGIGHDHSGNGNNWTPNGFSVTAGAGNDVLSDTPTTNWCTLNPLDSVAGNLINGNLEYYDTSGNGEYAASTMSFDIVNEKYYIEYEVGTLNYNYDRIGIMPETNSGIFAGTYGNYHAYYAVNGNKQPANTAFGASINAGDILGIAVGNGQIEYFKNGVSQGVLASGLTGRYKFTSSGAANAHGVYNFGQRAFAYDPPAGFKALNTANLPAPTIKDGSQYFDTTLRGPTYLQQNATFTVNINSGKSAFYGESNWLTTTPNDPTWQASGWARARREEGIGGYFDWYLPAYQELEVLYWNLKPTTEANAGGAYASGSNPYAVPAHGNYGASPTQTTVSIFQEGGSEAFETRGYWASSGPSGDSNAFTIQYFYSGLQLQRPSMSGASIRVIRREAVTGSEPSIGEAYAGGYLGGYISVNQNSVATHAIIVAPKAEGEMPSATMFSKAQETFANAMWWIKSRGGSNQHQLVDVVRGTTNVLQSPNTNAETTYTDPGETSVSWNWNVGENAGKTYTVKVVSDSGNKYRFDDFGTSAVTLSLAEGATYIFDQSDSSNSGHPLRFSTTSDGTHGAGSEYTTGVTVTGTPGQAGAKTTIVVAASAPTLYYYCSVHSGMGGQVDTTTTLGSSNFDGSIQSVVKSNPTAGFSIVTYTGTGANATVGHGLGVAPAMVIIKSRTTSDFWVVGHTSLGFTTDIYLRLNAASATEPGGGVAWNNTAPTSTVVHIGSSSVLNGNGNNLVMYAWTPVAGYSSFGSYTGNGSSDGPFVFCGFRPQWILLRPVSANYWMIFDTARTTYNPVEWGLFPNDPIQETYSTGYTTDLLSNGFKLRTSNWPNSSGTTVIFAAFAEHPFKYANAR